jgi:LytS/YehU family sensor histidine kinase
MLGFLPVYIISVYVFIYFLVPRFLQKKKYPGFFTGAFITGLFNFIACAFIAALIFKLKETPLEGAESFYAPLRSGFYQGVVLGLSTDGIACGIKLAKGWYLQQAENTKLTKLKKESEIKLLQTQIHPVFLLQSLNALHEKIMCSGDDAPATVLQLSDLLSYFLYESKEEFISLEKELEMAERLINIEKSNRKNNFSAEIFIDGDTESKYIAPLSLFSPLQNAFTKSENIHIAINIQEKFLKLDLSAHDDIITELPLHTTSQV